MDSKEQILHKQQMVSDIETDCKISTLIEHKNVEISLDEECSKDTILISSCFNMLIGQQKMMDSKNKSALNMADLFLYLSKV